MKAWSQLEDGTFERRKARFFDAFFRVDLSNWMIGFHVWRADQVGMTVLFGPLAIGFGWRLYPPNKVR